MILHLLTIAGYTALCVEHALIKAGFPLSGSPS